MTSGPPHPTRQLNPSEDQGHHGGKQYLYTPNSGERFTVVVELGRAAARAQSENDPRARCL
jgi:hypothetical protein